MKLVQKNNQAGLIQVIVLLVILAGLAAGVYLIQHQTNLFPKAAAPKPLPISSPITPLDQKHSRVFVTSTTYDGNLGGLAGADAKCQARADAANLGGTWKAWLSDSTTNAKFRLINSSRPYKLVNGTLLAKNWLDLTSTGNIRAPVRIDEFGQGMVYSNVWTNTDTGGLVVSSNPFENCNNWSSNNNSSGYFGIFGQVHRADSYWTNAGDIGCNQLHRLYCFEQTSVSASPVPRPTAPQIFQPKKR